MSSPGSVEGDARLRLFCALRLPEEILDRLVAWQAVHLSEGRAVPREHLHLTLAFLGSTPAAELPTVAAALESAAGTAGPIVFSEQRYRETRSVGMLVLEDGTGEARRLALRLFDELETLGVYTREKRSWLPHVTVLRFRTPPHLDPPLPELGSFSPSDAAVYSSVLRPSGAQYETLETVALGG
ncbi:MAG: RNA 2',3'-cyclic phosphodiesterase [Actinobacteria bacterium]|nr:RNA 2',3'-cyclic phosphodiesterase [Actinomycetota bacterium]